MKIVSVRATRRLGGTAICLVLALLTRPLPAVVDELSLGTGRDSFVVALVADPQNNLVNLAAIRDTINNRISSGQDVQLVMVIGDLTSTGDTTTGGEYDQFKTVMNGLTVPYVPLIGNHDMAFKKGGVEPDTVGDPPDSLFVTRGYAQKFEDVYQALEDMSGEPGAPIRDFVRYEDHPWNFEIEDWGGVLAYDVFQNFAFRVGPEGSPFRFVCLDHNTRHHATWWGGYGFSGPLGVNPEADLHWLPFNDRASSLRIVAENPEEPVEVVVYTDSGYTGSSGTYTTSGCHDLGPAFDNEVSSIRLGDNALKVVLYDDKGCEGDVRLALKESDRDLCVNGPAQWWMDYVRDYAENKPPEDPNDNVVVFAHHPSYSFPLGAWLGFTPGEYDDLGARLMDYRFDVGGWFAGHVHYGWTGCFVHGLLPSTICRWRVIPACARDDGHVSFLTLHYDTSPSFEPMVSPDESGVVPFYVDYTASDSAEVVVTVTGSGLLDIDVCGPGGLLRPIAEDTAVTENSILHIPWDCRDSAGELLPPGQDYYVKFTSGGVPMGRSPFVVKGTLVSGSVCGVWIPYMSPVVLTGDVTVLEGDTLRIQPGVRVMPQGSFGIDVRGKLVAAGQDTCPVLFTPFRRMEPEPDTALPGDWIGIRVEDYPNGLCSLDYCVIEYAGGTPGVDSAAVFCEAAGALSLTNSVIRYSSTRGYCADDKASLANFLHGDTFEYCASYPAAVLAESVHSVVHNNTFRNNETPALDVRAGNEYYEIKSNAEWLKCQPEEWRYDVTGGNLNVCPPAASRCTLSVSPGVTMRFGSNNALSLDNVSGRTGRLVANGASDPIVLTGMDTLNSGNYWLGVRFQQGTGGFLDSCTVSHSKANLVRLSTGASANLRHCKVRRALDAAVNIDAATLTLHGCELAEADTGLAVFGSCSPSVTATKFRQNSLYGVHTSAGQNIQLSGGSFEYNGIPARVRANLVTTVVGSNTFLGNIYRGVEVSHGTGTSGIRTGTHTWAASDQVYKYRCDDDIEVWNENGFGDDAGQPSGNDLGDALSGFDIPTLEIGAGAELEFDDCKSLKIGNELDSDERGVLEALGRADARIEFRNQQPGEYWGGIQLSYSDGTRLRYCDIDRGGHSDVNGAVVCYNSPAELFRCTVTNANRTDESKGIRVKYASPVIKGCTVSNCSLGMYVYNPDDESVRVDSTGFTGNRYGLYFANKGGARFRGCNFVGNQDYGAFNEDCDTAVDARYSWWGHSSGPYHPQTNPSGQGDRVSDSIRYSSWLTQPVQLDPALDVKADELVWPKGTIVSDTDYAVVPTGWVKNLFDDTLGPVPVTMRIGAGYEATLNPTLLAGERKYCTFPSCTLAPGLYPVRFFVHLAGDENPANDTLTDTLWIRRRLDAAMLGVSVPGDTITIEDTLRPAALVASLVDTALHVPVVFWLDSVVVETVYAEVAPLETTEVCFTERGFGKGGHELRFACCLTLDDDRTNDTIAAAVYVKTGDFWVAESTPPFDQARLCWAGEYVYAADRANAAVHRYDTGSGDWSAVAAPPVSGVYGITALDGQVYLVGTPGSDGGGSSGGLRAAGADRVRAGRDASAGIGTEAGFSVGPQLLRYDPAGDTWALVTECDSTVVLGSATALVADRSTGLYLVEGGSDRILHYDVEADSWAEPTGAPGVIDYWGAAGWADGVLYCLAGPRTLLAYSPDGLPEWRPVKLPDDNPENTCGTALGCDPVLDRALLFYPPALLSRRITEPFEALPRVFWELERGETWYRRAELASETTGAALCFASTQAYGLDGRGGFWRYRPQPVLDAASVAILAPDAVARESTFTPRGVVQNSWEDSLQFQVRLETEGYSNVHQVTVPPQSWDTVEFMPWSFPLDLPEPYEFTMTTLLGDERPFNDTVTDTVWVRYRRDAAAVGVNSPCGQVPYDSVVQPVGMVWNRCDEELSAWVIMTIDSCYADSVQRVLAPHAWVEVDSFATFTGLPLGPHEVKLRVRVEGDENPANDQCFGGFEVVNGGYWRRLAMTRQSEVVLAGGAGGEVLAADRWSMSASRYLAAGDTWVNAEQSPFEQHYSASRSGAGVYVLGRNWSEPEGGIARYDVDSASWSMVTESLPRFLPPSGAGCLLATGPDTLFLLVDDPDTNLFRYDVALDSWYPLAGLPVPVYEFTAGAWDGGDNLYVLGNNNAQLWRYSIAADSWEQRQGLWRSWPMGAALCCDRDRGLLYALWADLGSDLHQYDVGDDAWTWLPSYPGWLTRPALVFQDGKAYAHGGGQMFWEYLPKPATDIAAQAILSPPDTVRFDEMFLPVGVVENLSEDPAWCDVSFRIGWNVQFRQVYLAPEQVDTVYFDSTMAEAGRHTAVLQVMCQGDDNPANDVCEKAVVVSAPWAQRNPPPFFAGRLDADSGATVFAADRYSMTTTGYHVEGDTWSELVPPPFAWGIYDLSYHENRVYALGDDGMALARVGGEDSEQPLTDDPDPWAIYRYDLGDTAWVLVADSMPEPVCPYSWLTATGQGIYLLPGHGTGFYRHDSAAGWLAMAPVPAWVEPNCAMDWDRHDAIYLLTHNPDSSRFFRYSIAGDSWAERPALPVEAWPGLALAADPDTGTVLALNGPMFFEFDRQTETWSLRDGPPWSATDGAALCFAGPLAYALTGQPCTPSWFWCFDPAFEYGDRGSKDADGVAGAPGGLTNRLNRCTPNPFSRQTAISYQFVREGHVRLQVHDITGRRVRLLQNGRQTPGVYTVRWDGRDDRGNEVANGIYFYHLATPGFEDVKKAVVMR